MLAETEELLKDPSRKLVAAPREGQIAMGRRVAETMEAGGVLFAEAPVGTGKSYAYLVPAALSSGRTVVATAKKSLQDQLIESDLPAVKRATDKQFSFSILKGAGNYFCQHRARRLRNQTARAAIAGWQSTLTDIISDGDVATFPGGRPDFWPDVAVDSCHGDECTFAPSCGYHKLVKAAAESHVVVTNHHVLAHALIRGSSLFGDFRNLVIDEAHQFPEALRSVQTEGLDKPMLNNLYRRYVAAGGSLGNKLLYDAWDALSGDVDGVEGVFEPELVSQSVPGFRERLAVLVGDLNRPPDWDAPESVKRERKALKREFSNLLLRTDTAAAVIASPHTNFVRSVITSDYKTGAKEFRAQPIYPGYAAVEPLSKVHAVIMTSATLYVNGSFEHVARESGLPVPSDADSNSAGFRCTSPFNLRAQAVLYTPKHLPMPVAGKGEARLKWVYAISQEIKRLVEASDGNTMVLFTSNADLVSVHRQLQELGLEYPIIAQKPGQAAEAEQLYRNTDNAVLLASKSFFEGVNIVGDKLWSVIIPKLPFPVPSDPVIATKTRKVRARLEENGLSEVAASVQAFNRVCIPPMLVDLAQAAGRLIRTTSDRGVLSVLDPRLWTGSGSRLPKASDTVYSGYGIMAVEAIGFPRRTPDFERVKQYFASLRK